MSVYFNDPPWNCVCGQVNEFNDRNCVYCKIGERGMSRAHWQEIKDRIQKEEYEEYTKIRKLKELAEKLPEECQEKEDLVKIFKNKDGTLPYKIENAVFPHRIKKKTEEREKIREQARIEKIKAYKEKQKNDKISNIITVLFFILFFIFMIFSK